MARTEALEKGGGLQCGEVDTAPLWQEARGTESKATHLNSTALHAMLAIRHDFTFTFHFHAWEKEMATHSRVLAWRIPGMGEPGGRPSGSRRVGHN